jgi:diguanylate cyclase (GGDEF)-like protein
LIVDDSSDTRQHLRLLLEAGGYRGVRTAGSAQAALDLLGADNPGAEPPVDVVLMDVDMPGMDGIAACRVIKATPHLRDLSVLMVTGNGEEQTLELAFAAGASDYIAKPFGGPEVLARIRSALRLKRELDTSRARERELVQVTEQLSRLNEELRRLSLLDELTGIANRRFFNLLLTQEWGRAAREGLSLALLLIDLDHFQRYNAHYGHAQGDRCLVQVARALHVATRRPGDHVARRGGNEFVVLLPHTGAEGAAVFAERLRRRVQELGLEHAASPQAESVTVTVGVAATVPDQAGTPEGLLAAADQAVHQAKRAGRNRVQVFAPLPAPGPLRWEEHPAPM